MQAGVTTSPIKSRLGSTSHCSYISVRHVYAPINAIVHAVSPSINLEKDDPRLKELGDVVPYVDG